MLQTDEIIEMARQAGMVQDGDVWFSANNSEQCDVHTAELEAFAKLVADVATAKEREACAKVCDDINAVYNKPEDAAERVASQRCAERIRARGEA